MPMHYTENANGTLATLLLPGDPPGMNWVEGAGPWGSVTLPEGLRCRTERHLTEEGALLERYTFTNATDGILTAPTGSIAIRTPFNDSYDDPETCLTHRCHAHIHCGGKDSWVMALRMGATPPHLGLSLREGALATYSVERDPDQRSNDRGDFLLHPAEMHLNPGESCTIAWELFPHGGEADFLRHLSRHQPAWTMDCGVYFPGETIALHSAGCGSLYCRADAPGAHTFGHGDSQLILPPSEELAASRCRFIAQKQQCRQADSPLRGAYLIYDNESGKRYYSTLHDHNGARERMGMGALLALYLQHDRDAALLSSVMDYRAYLLREIVDPVSGIVYNDVGHSDSWRRLYNFPWATVFFMEMHKLTGNADDLRLAARILLEYYREDGAHFYAIGIPMTELHAQLLSAGEADLAAQLLRCFVTHGERIAANGVHYPASEVNFEQSIVAPAVEILLMVHQLTGDPRFLTAAREQLPVLEAFNAHQPDYHQCEVAIRHWDGYWFGKRRLFGDTCPHYWSSLTGNAFARYGAITGDATFLRQAEASLRASLTLIHPDGSASCAFVFPHTVNGQPGHFADPWANDQDWGLYFYLKHAWRL